MRKLITILGIIFLSIIVILNLLWTATLDSQEHINLSFNSVLYGIGLIAIGIFLFWITSRLNQFLYKDQDAKWKKRIRKILFFSVILIYIAFHVIWLINVNPRVVGDSIHVCNMAQAIYKNALENILDSNTYAGIPLGEYMQAYHQQIPLVFVFSLFFKLIHFEVMEVLRILNVISNLVILLAIYKIGKQLHKKHSVNMVLLLTLIFTFLTLPILSTFIYGDIPSLALCLMSVYFMMRYTETKKIRYPIGASFFMMVAYMMRMNSLIFIIATVMYLLLELLSEVRKKTWKENSFKLAIIVIYIAISIFPAGLVKNYYLEKYHMDKNKAYPNISYILMAMEEAPRGYGWYNETRGEYALRNMEVAKEEYKGYIQERMHYFSQNIGYTCRFYITKIASMWTENTYSALRNNITEDNNPLENGITPLTFYQKALLILTSVCAIIVLIQNRKNLSLEVLFLITIFVGGFSFHLLWEAKSRYIIPYVVVLIPVASICISKIGTAKKFETLHKFSEISFEMQQKF